MAVIIAPVPLSVRQAAAAGVASLSSDVMTPAHDIAVRSSPGAQIALRVFSMAGQGIAAGALPSRIAAQVGWRLRADMLDSGVVTVRSSGTPDEHRFAEFNVGPYSRASWAAVAEAAAFATVREGTFELTFLMVPTLFIEAVWLRTADGRDDHLLAYGRVPAAVSEHVVYRDREFVAVLRNAAAQRVALAKEFPS